MVVAERLREVLRAAQAGASMTLDTPELRAAAGKALDQKLVKHVGRAMDDHLYQLTAAGKALLDAGRPQLRLVVANGKRVNR